MSEQKIDVVLKLREIEDGAEEGHPIGLLAHESVAVIIGLRTRVAHLERLATRISVWQRVSAFGRRLTSLLETTLLWVGAISIAFGAYEIYRPAGPIAIGILIIVGVILRARGND